MYSVFSMNSGEALMVLQVGEAEKVSEILSTKGFRTVAIEDIK